MELLNIEKMKERIHEAMILLKVLTDSPHGNVNHVEEVCTVCNRLLEEAWVMADEISRGEAKQAGGGNGAPKKETTPPAVKTEKRRTEQFYAEDLIDQIALGYSAVHDMLQDIEKEPDPEKASTLAAMALVLYKNAVARKDEMVLELEKQTGKIQVLVDTTRGHSGYDLPIMGILIHPKQEAAHA